MAVDVVSGRIELGGRELLNGRHRGDAGPEPVAVCADPERRFRDSRAARLVGMGIDWENMLGASGNGLNDAYDSAVSSVIYSKDSGDDRRPLPVGEEHDDTDGLR
ncbi:hypothetical protein [Streptomyces sp. NPDC048142]|uniref:hypothetical protein n=1 Tax=Streptomyces sp. NPDC048142 TaxID=3365501 RepID=UPI003716E3DB